MGKSSSIDRLDRIVVNGDRAPENKKGLIFASMKLLFVCIQNSKRSQMAEAFAHMHGQGKVEAYSAGSRPSGTVDPMAIEAMKEKGYDLSTHRSKGLHEVPEGGYDAVVTMGCGEECPWIPADKREDWQLPDPSGADELRRVREMIEQEVSELLRDVQENE